MSHEVHGPAISPQSVVHVIDDTAEMLEIGRLIEREEPGLRSDRYARKVLKSIVGRLECKNKITHAVIQIKKK